MTQSTSISPASPPKPNTLFLQMVFLYVCLLSLAFGFESGLFKIISGVFAFWVFAVMAVNALFLSVGPRRHGSALGLPLLLSLLLFYLAMMANLLVNRGHTELQEWLKIMLAPMFIVFGFVFAARDRVLVWKSGINRALFWLLVLLPVMVWLAQLGMGRTALGGNNIVGPFVNRNNAALYYLTLVALYGSLRGRPVNHVWVYLFVGIAFGTLGVLLAVVLALLYAVSQRRNIGQLLLLAVAGAALVLLLPENMLLARLGPVADSYKLLVAEHIDLRTVSYGELVTRLRTTDLSFIFRLKHWTDLLDVYANGSVFQQLFGFGVGSALKLSQMRLVPHNDYVRMLFEGGLFAFVGFVGLLVVSLRHIGRCWDAVPLAAVCVYFVSENLINNYLAMIVFFFSLGTTLCRVRQLESV